MKKHALISILALVGILAGCANKEEHKVNNEFTLSTYELVFEGEASTQSVNVFHDVTSNAWGVRCALDDWWCTYSQYNDELVVSVEENDTGAERKTYAEVVIGEFSKRIEITQKAVVLPPPPVDEDIPSTLPDSIWDSFENEWK